MKSIPVGVLILLNTLFLCTVSFAETNRSAVIVRLMQTEPGVGRYLAQWYDSQMLRIANMREARAHWDKMYQAGEFTDTDYDFVINRDITR